MHRLYTPALSEDLGKFEAGVKQKWKAKDISSFLCKDCGHIFNADGLTRLETNKFG